MHKSRWFLLSSIVVAGLVLGLAVVRRPVGKPGTTAPSETLAPAATQAAKNAAPAPSTATSAIAKFEPKTSVGKFDAWLERYRAANDSEKAALAAEGVVLAKARLEELRELIKMDPKAALEQAIPYGTRKVLPAEIRAQLEQPVSGKGSFTVAIFCPLPGHEGEEPAPKREVKIGSQRYDTYVYGWRSDLVSQKSIAVHGMSIGDTLAVSEAGARVVSSEEATDLMAEGRAKFDTVCSVCSRAAAATGGQVLLDLGTGSYQTVCPEHSATVNDSIQFALALENKTTTSAMHRLAAMKSLSGRQQAQFWMPEQAFGGGGGGSTIPPGPAPGFLGQRTLLLVPAQFLDEAAPPLTQAAAQSAGQTINTFYNRASFGYEQMLTTVTPTVILPNRKQVYDEEGFGGIIGDAVGQAELLGYDTSQFDFLYVITTSIPAAKYGGISAGLVFGTGALTHEIGHNNGLGHANFFDNGRPAGPTQPNPALPIDPDSSSTANHSIGHADINGPYIAGLASPVGGGSGSTIEYGDPYDTMGGGGSDFSASMKASLGWLPPQTVRTVTASETNRLFAFDSGSVTNGRLYALRTGRTQTWGDYWISHRRAVGNNPWLLNGVEIQHGGSTTLLLDTTPGTPDGRQDGMVVVGRTFSDREAKVHVTPIARAGTGADAWIDVVIHRGDFPGNNAPVISSLAATSVDVPVGTPVTFTATANDADGDLLTYYFNFGDQTFGTNSAVNTHTFSAVGQYVVRCEVSDMKGGVASANLLVNVGSPSTFAVRGRVVDTDGLPVAGVRVHNGVAPGADGGNVPVAPGGYRYGFTDTDGYYIIPDLAPGTYTLGAFLHHYRTLPQNFNGLVTVTSAEVTSVDFTATPIPAVSVNVVSSAIEGGAPGVFRVSRTGSTADDLSVKILLSSPDSAVYSASTNGSVTIPAGSSFADVDITGFSDGVGDGGRHVRFTLQLVTNYFVVTSVLTNNQFVLRTNNILSPGWEVLPRLSDGAAVWYQTYPNYVLANSESTMGIVDTDPVGTPTVSVSAGNTGVVEGSHDIANFVFRRTGAPLTSDLTISYNLGGTATNGVDYLPLTGSVVIPAGQSQVAIPIVPINNYFVEGDRSVSVNVLPGAGYNNSGATAAITIVDDDLPSIGVFASDPRAGRAGGNTGVFTLTRNGDTTRDVLVNYLVTGNAVAGVDYTTLSGSVLIPAGSVSATVTVTPLATPSSPGPKSVILVLSDSPAYNTHGQGRATVKIADVVPTVTLAGAGGAAEGGGAGGFTVTRNGATTNALTVYFTVGGSANPNTDYSGIGTNVVIPVGQSSVAIPVAAIDDVFREFTATGQNNARLNEHETVQIALVESDTYDIGGSGSATITITDNDAGALSPGISFLTPTTVVREDSGSVSIPVRISGNPTNNPGLPVVVSYAITGGTAVQPVNYNAFFPTPGTLQFISNRVDTAGFEDQTQQIQFLDFGINDDGAVTGDRTIIINLAYYTNYITNVAAGVTNIIPYPTNFVLGDYRTHTIIIKDVDSATVSIQAIQPLAYEAGQQPGLFRVTRSGASPTLTNSALTVNLLVSGTAVNGADYATIPSTVTIPAGATSVDISVVPTDDVEQELAETVVVTLAQTPGVKFGQDTAQVVIVDNDGTVQFTFATYTVDESGGSANIEVLRTGATNQISKLDYVFADGTASNGVDYLGTNGTLTFAPGQTVQQITVPIVNDLLVEPTETFTITLTNVTGGAPLGGQNVATISIVDDDVGFAFSATNFSAYENATNAIITINRLGVTNAAVSVDFFTADGSATAGVDYGVVSNTITFNPGETSVTVPISLANDTILEGDETVLLSLANPSMGTTVVGAAAVLNIVDDDVRVEFGSANYSVIEYAGFVRVELRRFGGTEHPLTVGLSALDGTATNGSDYGFTDGPVTLAGDTTTVLTNGSGQIVFLAGETNKIVNVPILDDILGEGNETFQLVITNVTGPGGLPVGTFTMGTQTNTTVLIIDDEQPGFVDYQYRPMVAGGGVAGGGPTTLIAGTVRSATTGIGLPGVVVSVGTSSTVSGAGGLFTLSNAPVGSVQIDGNLVGYFPFNNTFTLLNQPSNVLEFAMSPLISGTSTIRLVLSWGANPADLDSHLETPPISGVPYHVFFANPGSQSNAPFAELDVDDVTGFGPETITITNTFPGTYVYYIHRFSGTGTIAGSGATVQVYTEAGLVNTVTAPATGVGDYWDVFQIDGATRTVSLINAFSANPPGVVTNLAPAIASQPRSITVDAGAQAAFSVVAGGSPPLFYQWRKGGAPLLGQTNAVLILNNVSNTDAGVYSVVVSNAINSVTSSNATLAVNITCGSGINGGLVYALAAFTNENKIVVGGAFTTVDGLGLRRVARLAPDGLVDSSFNPGIGANSNVLALAVQPDGKVFMGGAFTNVDGSNRVRVARLNVDGNVDATFNPGLGANSNVLALAVQPDGMVLVGGEFTTFAGDASHPFLARLDTNGVLDTNFSASVGARVLSIAVQTNGSILIGGCFSSVNGVPNNGIARLLADGTLDPSFNAGTGTDSAVRALALQADGKILAGGSFSSYNGTPVGFLVRLNPDGTFDSSFLDGTGADAPVNAIAVTPKGKIYVAGAFNSFNGQVRRGFTRLLPTGATDNVFNPGSGTDGPVFAAVAQLDSALVIGGNFTQVNSVPRTGLARIHGDEKSVVVEVELDQASYSVFENAGPAQVRVLRSGITTGSLSFDLVTRDGTAHNGTDFTGGIFPVFFAPGETNVTVNIPINNDGVVNADRTFTVSLTNVPPAVLQFDPTNAVVNILDDDGGPGSLSFTAASYSVVESVGLATISVRRTPGSSGSVSVQFETLDGTALQNSDYVYTNGSVSFARGETNKTFAVRILNDRLIEANKSLQLRLFSATGGATLGLSNASLTIVDDDFAGTFAFTSTNYTGNEGNGAAVITVSRLVDNVGDVTVNFATGGGTAAPGFDYSATNGTLSWLNGDSSNKTFTVQLVNDSIGRASRTVGLALSTPTGGAFVGSPNQSTLTIVDDDVSLSFASANFSVIESNGTAAITVVRTGSTNGAVSVSYFTTNGTATAGVDYTNVAGTLFWADGDSAPQTFNVPLVNDSTVEGDKTVQLFVFNPVGATLTTPNAALLTIVDDDASLFFESSGTRLVTESGPVNGVIDPSETVTVEFALRNIGSTNSSSLVATLVATNGITPLSGSQNYGSVLAGGPAVARSFMFTATGTNGASLTAVVHLQDGATDYGYVPFVFDLGTRTTRFSTNSAIVINDNAVATPYPSRLNVAGVLGSVRKVSATLSNLTHTFPADIRVLLVSPTGENAILMANVGSTTDSPGPVSNVTLTFDDAAASSLTTNQIVSGAYKPSNRAIGNFFPSPAPSGSYGTALSAFNGINPNGTWLLYVLDVDPLNVGSLGSWGLTFVDGAEVNPRGDLAVSVVVSPSPVVAGANATFSLTVTNRGSNPANYVALTNTLPAGFTFVSAANTNGGYYQSGATVIFDLGSIAARTSVQASIVALAGSGTGTLTNGVTVASSLTETNSGNNSAVFTSSVIAPPNLTISVVGANLVVSWPVAAGNLILQSADSLTTPLVWLPVGISPVVVGSNWTVTIPITPASAGRFYSLTAP